VADADDSRQAPLPTDLDRLLHDLRGPLNAAVMHLEVLKRVLSEDPTARASLSTIHQEIERLAQMLPVAFSICALEMTGPPRTLLLRDLVESAIDESARKRVHVEAGPWPDVDGDERLLVRAIHELVMNALEAGGDDGEVRVGVEPRADGTVALVVRDGGLGFKTRNPSAIIRLMAAAKSGHLGIGLLIAQRIARLHGGTLAFETESRGGVVRLILQARPR
jgi:two-component system, OmpR family, sensor histidine kinase SenX3